MTDIANAKVMFRVRYTNMGTHVRGRVYVGKPGTTLALSGTLIVRTEEWEAFCAGQSAYELVEEPEGGE